MKLDGAVSIGTCAEYHCLLIKIKFKPQEKKPPNNLNRSLSNILRINTK